MVKQVKLTRKRQLWTDSREKNNNVTLKGTELNHCISSEHRYAKKLERLTQLMYEDVKRQINRFFNSEVSREHFAQDASISAQARFLMNKLMRKYNDQFSKISPRIARQMINDVNNVSKSSLFSSIEKLTGGARIKTDFINDDMKEVMKGAAQESADLIITIPRDFLSDVGGYVYRSITQPEFGGIQGIIERINPLIDERYRKQHNKARNVAYDQTRKTFNSINAQRMIAVGIHRYEWVHSRAGQRPRKHHLENLDGRIFSLDKPPIIEPRTGERGIPGQAINCRCTMRPILGFGDNDD